MSISFRHLRYFDRLVFLAKLLLFSIHYHRSVLFDFTLPITPYS
jgi:hypothetical protein